MLLDAYSQRDLQHLRGILATAQSAGMSLDGLLSAVDARLLPLTGAVVQEREAMPLTPCPTIREDGTRCPGRLLPVGNTSGLIIIGCKVCRYSQVT